MNTGNTVTQQQIDEIIANGKVEVMTLGEKTTLVKFTSKEGFEIVATSACVSPENYNEEKGKEICLEKVKNKLWELEGYCLQKELYELSEKTRKLTSGDITVREYLNSLPDEEFVNYLAKQKDGICISDTNKEFEIRCEKMYDDCRKCMLDFLKSNYSKNSNS